MVVCLQISVDADAVIDWSTGVLRLLPGVSCPSPLRFLVFWSQGLRILMHSLTSAFDIKAERDKVFHIELQYIHHLADVFVQSDIQ